MSTTTPSIDRDAVQPVVAPPHRRRHGRGWLGRIVFGLSLLNFAAVLTLVVLFCVVSENWWVSLAMSYLPRVPYVVPSLLLAAAALLLRRRIVWLNLAAALLVLGPIMGFRAPLAAPGGGASDPLTVVSYNVQAGGNDVDQIVAALVELDPDVFLLQEASRGVEPIKERFQDYHLVHWGEFLVGSRWPLSLKDVCRAEAFRRPTAFLCKVDHPDGPFLVCDVHQTTARYGLAKLRLDSLLSGRGVDALEERQALRGMEAFETRNFVADLGLETPLLVMGDFNMPSSSSLFQQYWGGLTSAFDAAGWGYGYTSPCNTGTRWPANMPWLRIDHILLSSHWNVESCWIGETNGSDHRCIAARVRRR